MWEIPASFFRGKAVPFGKCRLKPAFELLFKGPLGRIKSQVAAARFQSGKWTEGVRKLPPLERPLSMPILGKLVAPSGTISGETIRDHGVSLQSTLPMLKI